MAMIIDFAKYKATKEIDAYHTQGGDDQYLFGCPECGNTAFHLYLDMRAVCSGCELEVYLDVSEHDEL